MWLTEALLDVAEEEDGALWYEPCDLMHRRKRSKDTLTPLTHHRVSNNKSQPTPSSPAPNPESPGPE